MLISNKTFILVILSFSTSFSQLCYSNLIFYKYQPLVGFSFQPLAGFDNNVTILLDNPMRDVKNATGQAAQHISRLADRSGAFKSMLADIFHFADDHSVDPALTVALGYYFQHYNQLGFVPFDENATRLSLSPRSLPGQAPIVSELFLDLPLLENDPDLLVNRTIPHEMSHIIRNLRAINVNRTKYDDRLNLFVLDFFGISNSIGTYIDEFENIEAPFFQSPHGFSENAVRRDLGLNEIGSYGRLGSEYFVMRLALDRRDLYQNYFGEQPRQYFILEQTYLRGSNFYADPIAGSIIVTGLATFYLYFLKNLILGHSAN